MAVARTSAHQTDPNKTQQLSAAQLAAVDLVVLGEPDGAVAEAVGVTRPTVWGWRHYHPGFMAALNARRREVFGQTADRLRALLGRAIDVLAAELDVARPDGETLKVALKILDYGGPLLSGQVVHIGPEDADALLEVAYGPPPEAHELADAEDDTEEGDEP